VSRHGGLVKGMHSCGGFIFLAPLTFYSAVVQLGSHYAGNKQFRPPTSFVVESVTDLSMSEMRKKFPAGV
jgi:hypothetical protein